MNTAETGKAVRKWITLYLAAVTYIIIPLYMKKGYFGLIEAKARAYLYLSIPAILVILMITAAELSSVADGKPAESAPKPPAAAQSKALKGEKASLIILILIGIWSLATSFLSPNPKMSITGAAGWYVGSLMTVVLIVSTIYISRNFQPNKYMTIAVIAVNTFIILFALAQSAGADPFGFLRYIDESQHYAYLSTIGQKNSFSGYLCLIFPLFWGLFITCKAPAEKILLGFFSLMGFGGVIAAESDSAYAGIGICLLFILLSVFQNEQHFKNASILLVLYGACLLAVRYLPVFSGKTEMFGGISEAMIAGPVAETICAAGLLLYLIGWKLIRGKRRKYILIALEAALLIGICAYAVYTAMHFDDEWGTERGMIWRVGWERFLRFPLRQKIAGVGPEMLITVFPELRETMGQNVVTAHCEPLQVLLTEGLVGLGLYFAFWGNMLLLFFKNKLWRKREAVYFFPLAAYWGQSLFCTVYPITAVVFSFAAGMYLHAGLDYEPCTPEIRPPVREESDFERRKEEEVIV